MTKYTEKINANQKKMALGAKIQSNKHPFKCNYWKVSCKSTEFGLVLLCLLFYFIQLRLEGINPAAMFNDTAR